MGVLCACVCVRMCVCACVRVCVCACVRVRVCCPGSRLVSSMVVISILETYVYMTLVKPHSALFILT